MPIEMKAAEKRSRLWKKLPPPQKDPLAAPPENEIVGSVIEAPKRAQRTFQETFFETPPVDPTVRRNTRPVLPGCGANVPNRTSSAIYEDSDGQFYSFNEGAPLRRVQTLPSTTSQKRMKVTCV